MYASASILIFGHDPILLETRRLILKNAGFQVSTATDAIETIQVLARKPIDLLMLCQSLSLDESVAILKTAHKLRPDMKNLIMGGEILGDLDKSVHKHDTFLMNYLDPRSLISLIQSEINADRVAPSIQ